MQFHETAPAREPSVSNLSWKRERKLQSVLGKKWKETANNYKQKKERRSIHD
jgi:hypothetical protein